MPGAELLADGHVQRMISIDLRIKSYVEQRMLLVCAQEGEFTDSSENASAHSY